MVLVRKEFVVKRRRRRVGSLSTHLFGLLNILYARAEGCCEFSGFHVGVDVSLEHEALGEERNSYCRIALFSYPFLTPAAMEQRLQVLPLLIFRQHRRRPLSRFGGQLWEPEFC